MVGNSALPSVDGKPKDACKEGFLLSRNARAFLHEQEMHEQGSPGQAAAQPRAVMHGYIPSYLLYTPTLVCLSAFLPKHHH